MWLEAPVRTRSAGRWHDSPLARLVVILWGQSNAKGRVTLSALPGYLSGALARCLMWNGSAWVTLQAKTANGYPEAGLDWGPEMALMKLMRDSYQGPVYLIKHALSGTALAPTTAPTWNPNTVGSLKDTGVTEITQALASLAGPAPVKVLGGLWVQGETDAQAGVTQAAYRALEAQLFASLRSAVGDPLLPILNVQILPQVSGAAAVNAAKVQNAGPNTRVLSSENFGHLGDNLHFDAAAQIAVGRAAFEFFAA